MKLTEGVDTLISEYESGSYRGNLLEGTFLLLRSNWRSRDGDRWPTNRNWQFRLAPDVTFHREKYLEKQLQKAIANCLHADGWGNDVPTASGLIDAGNRQMNIDLVERIPDGFNFIELKIASNNPSRAAFQAVRYAALHLLYRLEPELAARFSGNEMLSAKVVSFEVLAPYKYFADSDWGLVALQESINSDFADFCTKYEVNMQMSFHFRCFPQDFVFVPGCNCTKIRQAILHRHFPTPQEPWQMYASLATKREDELYRERVPSSSSDPQSWLGKWSRLRFHQKLSVIGICVVFAVWFWAKLDRVFR